MNTSGDAAEQVVRMSLEGVEVAAKITGRGAEQLGMKLYAVLKEEQKTKGKARLTSMLKSGKELKVFTVQQKDLKKFSQEAKRYGVLYCVLKDKGGDPRAQVDVIARAEDASKIQRITERFRLATIDTAQVFGSVEKDRMFPKEVNREDRGKGSQLVNPTKAKTEKSPLSEPSLKETDRSSGSIRESGRPSVREKLTTYREKAERARRETIQEKGNDLSKAIADQLSKMSKNVTNKER